MSLCWMNNEASTMYLSGDINQSKTGLLAEFLTTLKGNPGTIFINSEGGDTTQGFAMYDLMKLSGSEITAIVVGQCMSSAILPLLAAQIRYCTNNASFMIHHGTLEITPPEHTRDAITELKEAEREDEKYMELIAIETNMSMKEVRRKMKFGFYFGAIEAEKHGFINQILDKR